MNISPQQKSYLTASIVAVVAFVWIMTGDFFIFSQDATAQDVQEKPIEQKAVKPVAVQVLLSRAQDFKRQKTVTGVTHPSQSVTLKSEIDGRIIGLSQNEGDFVEKGTPLIRIATEDRAARLAEAEQSVKERRIDLKSAKSLVKKKLGSQSSLIQARAALERAKADLETAKLALANTTVIAPFDGYFETEMVEVGDYIQKGGDVAQFVRTNPLEITAYVSEDIRAYLQKETPFSVVTMAKPERQANGKLSFVSQSADQQTRTFRIKGVIPNDDKKLRGGETVQIALTLEEGVSRGHFISPSALTLNDQGVVGVKISLEKESLMLEHEAKFVAIDILEARPNGIWIGGLPDMASIIVVGQEFVKDGTAISPQSASSGDS